MGILNIFIHRTAIEKTSLKKNCLMKEFIIIIIIIIMKIVRKCCFYRSLFGSFSHADDHWEVILALKSAAPCRCMLK